jgi:hypothetical protein
VKFPFSGLQKNTKISEAAEDNIGSAGILPAFLLLQKASETLALPRNH